MGYRTILAGTDGSDTATTALRRTARLAKRCRAEVLILCAFEPPALDAAGAGAILERAREEVAAGGVEARTVLQVGRAADVIVGVARRNRVDLVVVGNRGMGKARRLTLGGVADAVAHHAPGDVLIVDTAGTASRGEDEAEAKGSPYRSILVGAGGSPTAVEAARKAFELALMLRAAVTLVHVGDPLLGAIALEETAKGRLGNTEVRTRAVEGEAATALLEVAEAEATDLIVVGNRGMAGARRLLLASVPNQIAHSARADVLIAKTVGRSVADLAPGHGGIVAAEGRTVAAYKDEEGQVTYLSPRCTHMGCTVDWNDADRTWDCPCHGSRYAVDGTVVEGPAERPLARA